MEQNSGMVSIDPSPDDPLSGCSNLTVLSGIGNNIPFGASGHLSVEYRYSSPAACPKRNAGRGIGGCVIVTG